MILKKFLVAGKKKKGTNKHLEKYSEWPMNRTFYQKFEYLNKLSHGCLVSSTKLPCYTLSPTQHHSFFRNLPPLYHGWM